MNTDSITLKGSNQAYIECLEVNSDYVMYMAKKKTQISFNISKVSTAYVAYLASKNNKEYYKKWRNFIRKYGGTSFLKKLWRVMTVNEKILFS